VFQKRSSGVFWVISSAHHFVASFSFNFASFSRLISRILSFIPTS
jgi:hypothetical protein